MTLKFDLTLIVAIIAFGAVWVEHEHRLVLDVPRESAPAAAVCPDTDIVPYSAGCLEFLKGATSTGMRWRINAHDNAWAAPPAQRPKRR